MTRRSQRGVASVEFAIISAVVLTCILAVMEFGRLLFAFSVLNESSRRAARLAAVCPIGAPGIARAALFARLPGMTPGNVQVDYLTSGGAPVTVPGSAAGFATIRYVRVRITGYAHQLAVPFVGRRFAMPTFATTHPRESLGISREGVTPCP